MSDSFVRNCLNLLEEGKTISEIAELHNISKQVLKNKLKCDLDKFEKKKAKAEGKVEIAARYNMYYKRGYSMDQIAQIFNTNQTKVCKLLHFYLTYQYENILDNVD